MVYVGKCSETFHEWWCPYKARIKIFTMLDEQDARNKGYCECKFCRSTKGLAYRYRKWPLIGLDSFYDPIDDALCFKTKAGFWKLIWYENELAWHLFHLNHGCFWENRPVKHMMRRTFHRQTDMQPTSSVAKIANYIIKHDENYTRTDGDYHKMPRTSKKQKKYYQQAKKRARKKSVRNVYKILDELNQNGSKKGEIVHG